MHLPLRPGGLRRQPRARLPVGPPQPGEPRLAVGRLGRLEQLAQDELRVAGEPHRHLAAPSDLGGVHVDLDHARVRAPARRPPVGEHEVEARADDEGDVRAAERPRAGGADVQRMVVREHAARGVRDDHRNAQALDEGRELGGGVRPEDAAAGDDERALRTREEAAAAATDSAAAEERGEGAARLGLGLVAQHVGGHLEEHRAGPARARLGERARDVLGQPLRLVDRRRPLRDRAHERDLVSSCSPRGRPARAAAGRRTGRPAPPRPGVGEGRGRVRDARAGGDEGDAGLAGRARPGVRHVRGGLLVAHVDEPDARVHAGVGDRRRVAADEREDVRDAGSAERARDELAAPHAARGAAAGSTSARAAAAGSSSRE